MNLEFVLGNQLSNTRLHPKRYSKASFANHPPQFRLKPAPSRRRWFIAIVPLSFAQFNSAAIAALATAIMRAALAALGGGNRVRVISFRQPSTASRIHCLLLTQKCKAGPSAPPLQFPGLTMQPLGEPS